jgi:hypothetical protein
MKGEKRNRKRRISHDDRNVEAEILNVKSKSNKGNSKNTSAG